MNGMLSKDTTLKFKRTTDAEAVLATGLLQVPPMGGEVDQIETTTLSDGIKKYINGLKDAGDLSMQFLFDNSSADTPYRAFKTAQEAADTVEFTITLPDGTEFGFAGIPSVTMDEITVNDRITFTARVALQTEITLTDPEY